MHTILNLQRKLVPELAELLELRYDLLRQIALNQPVGRRMLAARTELSERVLRAQVDFLKQTGLLDFSHLGMTLTEEGRYLLDRFSSYIKEVKGITLLERQLAKNLSLEKVIVVPGDSKQSEVAFYDLGYTGATVLKDYILPEGSKSIAISGGNTMRTLAEAVSYKAPNALVLPARGGLGDDAKQQANSIAAFLAGKLGASYRQIYIPDAVSEKTLTVMLEEDEELCKVLGLMQNTDVMVHGIGGAECMAKRRGAHNDELRQLEAAGAVGEALGKYYTLSGKEVGPDKKTAILLDDYSGINKIVAVAGGNDKAEAILAVCRAGNVNVLVTDFAAASEITQCFK